MPRPTCGICRPVDPASPMGCSPRTGPLQASDPVSVWVRELGCPGQPRTRAHFCHAGAFRGLLCLTRWCGSPTQSPGAPLSPVLREDAGYSGSRSPPCEGDERNLRRRQVTNLRISTDFIDCRLLCPVDSANSSELRFPAWGQEVVARGHPAFIPRSLLSARSGPVAGRKRRD